MVLLELSETCFHLLSQGLQEVLPVSHEGSLPVIGDNNNTILLPEPFTHGAGGIVAIADNYLGSCIHEFLQMLSIILVGWRKAEGC